MNVEYFIAKRIHFQQGKKNVSRPAVRIATIGIALGLAVMLISVCVVIGFKSQIENKIIGFGGHIQITNFDNNNTYEMNPIKMDPALIQKIRQIPGVVHVQRFATKPGIIKTDKEFQGIILKGIDKDFDWNFFRSNLLEGNILNVRSDTLKNEILLSRNLSNLLGLKLGDELFMYFIQDQVRARKFKIVGIFSTNFVDYDQMFVLTDIRQVQRLNNWDSASFGGLEVLIDDFNKIDERGEAVYAATANIFSRDGNAYYTQTIKQLNPQIFSWLDLLDMNVWVILILMLSVAGFNMISGLLILILERTNMIGILKSLGATNWSVRKIFLYHSFFLIAKGMFWGNLIGLSICAIQYFTGIIPLDPEAYYVASVPVAFPWGYIVLLNVGTLIASVLMMIAPSYLITKISPAKIIRYE
ncbi:MAG TPA: ABC transporter permease [Paludibacteraceae bacterium]|nr:ABC transporter permease [Paludibacteraceae bacterium]MDS1031887.1 FtsX-like permease family protein [Porphyromonadaceae sp. NP-X]NLJ20288.1 ABC transporter permease [Bacteroidales bacterium]HNZ62400.1 ABC transporter permease [Paludibacteraceae bacterium]HOH55663.1 ABC transporter permease [Paludibacteraceae bacterium]